MSQESTSILQEIATIFSRLTFDDSNNLKINVQSRNNPVDDIVASVPGLRTDFWQDQSIAAGEDCSGGAGVTIQAAVPAKFHHISFVKITATAAATVWVSDEDDAIEISKSVLAAGESLILPLGLTPRKQTTVNKALEIHSSTADVLHWNIMGYTL